MFSSGFLVLAGEQLQEIVLIAIVLFLSRGCVGHFSFEVKLGGVCRAKQLNLSVLTQLLVSPIVDFLIFCIIDGLETGEDFVLESTKVSLGARGANRKGMLQLEDVVVKFHLHFNKFISRGY